LHPPLNAHLDDWLHGIGITPGGDLLFASFGKSAQQRTVVKYSTKGAWLRNYTHVNLQHVQGTPTGTDEVVFIASRFDPGIGFTETILAFCEDGTYIGQFGEENGGIVGDVTVMGDRLYSLDFDDGFRVYDVSGCSLPTYSHLIPFPTGVEPNDAWGDEQYAWGGYLYVTAKFEETCYKINLAGDLVCHYQADMGSGPFGAFGSIAVVFSCEGDATEDGIVDSLDVEYVLVRFGCEVGIGDSDCDLADQNGDGLVDPRDSGFVLARFGDCP